MNRAKLLVTMIIPFIVTACGTFKDIKNANIGIDFDTSARNYNRLVRWQELESAAAAFVTPVNMQNYRTRVAAAKGVQITDYRINAMECDPARGEGRAKVEFEYYRPPSATIHTVEDVQKWLYEEENGRGIWRLQTLLPEFR